MIQEYPFLTHPVVMFLLLTLLAAVIQILLFVNSRKLIVDKLENNVANRLKMLRITGKCDEDCVNVQLGRIFNSVGDFSTGKSYCIQVKDPFNCSNAEGMDCLITSYNSLHEEHQALPYLHQLLKCKTLQNIHHIRQLQSFFDIQNDRESLRQLSTYVSSNFDRWSYDHPNAQSRLIVPIIRKEQSTVIVPIIREEQTMEVEEGTNEPAPTTTVLTMPDNDSIEITPIQDSKDSEELPSIVCNVDLTRSESSQEEEIKLAVTDSAENLETLPLADLVETNSSPATAASLLSDETIQASNPTVAIEIIRFQDTYTTEAVEEKTDEEKSFISNRESKEFVTEKDDIINISMAIEFSATNELVAQNNELILNQEDATVVLFEKISSIPTVASEQVIGSAAVEVEDAVLSLKSANELSIPPEIVAETEHISSIQAPSTPALENNSLVPTNGPVAVNETTPIVTTTVDSQPSDVDTTTKVINATPTPPKPSPAAATAKPCAILHSYQTLALAYLQREDYVNGLKQYTKIIKKCPWVLEMYFARAQIYHYYLADLASSKQDYYHVYNQLHPTTATITKTTTSSSPPPMSVTMVSSNITSGMITQSLWTLQEEYIDKVYPTNPTQAMEIIRHIHRTIYEPFSTGPIPGQPYPQSEETTAIATVATSAKTEISLMDRIYRCQWIISILVELHEYVAAIQEMIQFFPFQLLTSFDPSTATTSTAMNGGFTATKHKQLVLDFITVAFQAARIDAHSLSTVQELIQIAMDYNYLTLQQIGDQYYEHHFYLQAIEYYTQALNAIAKNAILSGDESTSRNVPVKKGLFHQTPGHVHHHASMVSILHYKLGRCYHMMLLHTLPPVNHSTTNTNESVTTSMDLSMLFQAYEHYEKALQSGFELQPEMRKFYAMFADQLPSLSSSPTTTTTATDLESKEPSGIDRVLTDNQTLLVDTPVAMNKSGENVTVTEEHQSNSKSYRRLPTTQWVVKYHKHANEKSKSTTHGGNGGTMRMNSLGGNGGLGSAGLQQLFGAPAATNDEQQQDEEEENSAASTPFSSILQNQEAKQAAEAKAEKAAKEAQAKINAGNKKW